MCNTYLIRQGVLYNGYNTCLKGGTLVNKIVVLALLILCLMGLVVGCQTQLKYEVIPDSTSLPAVMQSSVEVLKGNKGHFALRPGYFMFHQEKDTFIWIQSLDYPMKVDSLTVENKVLTLCVTEGALGTDSTSFAVVVRGTHEQVKIVDIAKGQDFPLLSYEETITGLRGTFKGSDKNSNEIYIQVDKDLSWFENSNPTAFVVPPPLRAEMEQLTPDYHRINLDALRDKDGNLHIIDHTVEEPGQPNIAVAFERYAAHYEPQASPGVTFTSFEQEIMHEQEPRFTQLTVHRGESPSTGYGIRINEIFTNGLGYLDVHVSHLNPTPDSQQSDVITYPVDTVIIEGWNPLASFRMVVDDVLTGPFDPEEISFTPYNYTPESMSDELGIVIQPLVYQTQGVDTAIAAHRAKCPTTGYDIKITRVTMDYEGIVSVYVKLTDPPQGSMQAQVITQPFDAVKIPGYRASWQYKIVVMKSEH